MVHGLATCDVTPELQDYSSRCPRCTNQRIVIHERALPRMKQPCQCATVVVDEYEYKNVTMVAMTV
jgi:hypothetical protein